jgi:hypothetical protein
VPFLFDQRRARMYELTLPYCRHESSQNSAKRLKEDHGKCFPTSLALICLNMIEPRPQPDSPCPCAGADPAFLVKSDPTLFVRRETPKSLSMASTTQASATAALKPFSKQQPKLKAPTFEALQQQRRQLPIYVARSKLLEVIKAQNTVIGMSFLTMSLLAPSTEITNPACSGRRDRKWENNAGWRFRSRIDFYLEIFLPPFSPLPMCCSFLCPVCLASTIPL